VSSTGCRIDLTRFQPRKPRTEVPVILAHGFLRDQRRLEGLARSLAAQGIPAVTLSLCNSRPWDGRHVQNGRDMMDLARHLGATEVLYGGFSAGALAALVAGRLDPKARGVLTLDLVDRGGIGAGMARGLDKPLIGLTGEPAACNARGNGLSVFAAHPSARVIPVRGASHCDFESPTDWLCEAICAPGAPGTETRRREIVERFVAAAADLLGLDATGS
jgi:hypothetical protein